MILNISCILFMIITFFMIMLFTWFYVRVDIVLTCTASFHQEGEEWADNAILILRLFNEVAVSSLECYRICICVLGA